MSLLFEKHKHPDSALGLMFQLLEQVSEQPRVLCKTPLFAKHRSLQNTVLLTVDLAYLL